MRERRDTTATAAEPPSRSKPGISLVPSAAAPAAAGPAPRWSRTGPPALMGRWPA